MKKFKVGKYYIKGTTELLSYGDNNYIDIFKCIELRKSSDGDLKAVLVRLSENRIPLDDCVGCYYIKNDNVVVYDDRYGHFVLYDEKKEKQLKKHLDAARLKSERIQFFFNEFNHIETMESLNSFHQKDNKE